MLVFFQEMANIFIRKRHRLYKKTRPARKALAVEADERSTSSACSVALCEPATSCDVDPAVGLVTTNPSGTFGLLLFPACPSAQLRALGITAQLASSRTAHLSHRLVELVDSLHLKSTLLHTLSCRGQRLHANQHPAKHI